MNRKRVQCYVFLLTLLDISLNTTLTAQGKSHDVSIHDIGIAFQEEWGKSLSSSGAAEALRLSPPVLSFGRVSLAATHLLTVTVTNTANTTIHLASVAGTTPDFHASFFESKALPPQANTTFKVVYLGRHEGPVSAHLYIHTSLGVHKYLVSAEGVASEWGVWPLVGLRVPQDASFEPLLELYNPTDQIVQVSEVHSTSSWVLLSLPEVLGADEENEGVAPGETWRVPPRESRPIVRLHVRPPYPSTDRLRTAYIRIMGSRIGGASNELVVGVEAVGVGAGAYFTPPQLRLTLRGSGDPTHTWQLSAGNSGGETVKLEGGVWGARCSRKPPDPTLPPPLRPLHSAKPGQERSEPVHVNGAGAEGVSVRMLRGQLPPNQEPVHALQLTFNYDRMWASYAGGAEAGAAAEGADARAASEVAGAWCSGWVVAGGAVMPYSVRLLPGTLVFDPPELHIVTADQNGAGRIRKLRAHNRFPVPVHVQQMQCGHLLQQYFQCTSLAPLVLEAGGVAVVGELRTRLPAPPPMRDVITLHTNVTVYTLPVFVHTGVFHLEWERSGVEGDVLDLGTLCSGCSTRVSARVYNHGQKPLCARDIHVRVTPSAAAHATFTIGDCPRPDPPLDHPCRCVSGDGWANASLTLVAGADAGTVWGQVEVWSPHAASTQAVRTQVRVGTLQAQQLHINDAAPYMNKWSPLVLESTMPVGMRVLGLAQSDPHLALDFVSWGSGWVTTGRHTVGGVRYAAERRCPPHDCYTTLSDDTPEGVAWLERGAVNNHTTLQEDVQLMEKRRAMTLAIPPLPPYTLYIQTTEVLRVPVQVSVSWRWPRVSRVEVAGTGMRLGVGADVVAVVGGAAEARVRIHNPATLPMLLQPFIYHPITPQSTHQLPEELKSFCSSEECVWNTDAFKITEWRALTGNVTAAVQLNPLSPTATSPTDGVVPPAFLLDPDAEIELGITFAPSVAVPLITYLYLRNNYTVVEVVPLSGRGAHSSFELGGRRPGTAAPIVFEVAECPAAGVGVRRQLAVRNTGPVSLHLRDWRLAGRPCAARGFRLHPCAPLALAPNETRTIRIAFHPDYTLARVLAALTVRADAVRAEFRLRAALPASLLRECATQIPPPPFDSLLRAAGTALALAMFALVIAAAALDAERALRRARHSRPPALPPARAPLDLRAAADVPPPPPPPSRRRRAARRPPPPDPRAPLAERRAFERWRAEVLRRADRDEDHSSEDGAHPKTPPPASPSLPAPTCSSPSPEPDEAAATRPSSDDAVPSGGSSVGSSDSSPSDDLEGREDVEPDALTTPGRPPEEPTNTPEAESPPRRPEPRRDPRPRRDPGEQARRPDRRALESVEGRPRPAPMRVPGRRDKGGRRRIGERMNGLPSCSPPAVVPEVRAPAVVRWGASWSSVVAAGPGAGVSQPPIGSDMHRRAEERSDQSLFYFNGEQPPPPPPERFQWRVTPPLERARYPQNVNDYINDFDDATTYGSVWAGGAWAWDGGLAVRPPPGFGGPAAPPVPRAYDPFRSLAALWAPGVLDWRADPSSASTTHTHTHIHIHGLNPAARSEDPRRGK